MANKSDRIYYENLIGAAEYCCCAADYLVECLSTYDHSKIHTMMERMHGIEHSADKKKHEMSELLAKAFVTPLDREDLAELSHYIDDVADIIEEVLQRFYVDEVQTILPGSVEFAKEIAGCCKLMKEMLVELENFKKPQRLHTCTIRVSDAEEECDQLYLEAILQVRHQFKDPMDIITWRTIYNLMESCADACSHVADAVETIVMKNT